MLLKTAYKNGYKDGYKAGTKPIISMNKRRNMPDKIDAKALNEKLAIWVGFHIPINEYDGKPFRHGKDCANIWESPIKEFVNELPNLVGSLDEQHKWLWKKLKEIGYMVRYQYSELYDNDTGKKLFNWTYYCTLYDVSRKYLHSYNPDGFSNDNPAIACAIAVGKLIDWLEKEKEQCSLDGLIHP